MKIGLIGPQTQVQHIVQLFKKNDVEYVVLNETFKKGNVLTKYVNYVKIIREVGVIYSIGIAFRINPKIIIPKIFGKKVINHWIGSDVLVAKRGKTSKINQLFIDKNLSCSSLIKEELNEMGIRSTLIPIIPSGLKYDIAKMPANHGVLVYLPEGKEEFYGLKYVELLANKFSNVLFYIVANTNSKLILLDNVIFMGKLGLVEMEKLYDKISILLRLPEHDGLSLMLIEALAKGKKVIYKYDFPHVYTIKNEEELVYIFKQIVEEEPTINYEANRFINENYNEEVIYEMIKREFSN